MLLLVVLSRRPGPGPIKPPWDPTKNRTMYFEVQVVDNTTGQGIPNMKVTIGMATLSTNDTGFAKYQYNSRKTQTFNVSVAEGNGYPGAVTSGAIKLIIRLTPKSPVQLGPSVQLVDEITMKPIPSMSCNISIQGSYVGVFATNKEGIITFTQSQLSPGQQIDLKINSLRAYSKDVVTIKTQAGLNVIKIQRVITGYQQIGFIMYDNVTMRRIPNVSFKLETGRGTFTITGDKSGIVLIEANADNKIWAGDKIKITATAPGYQQQSQEIMFPGFPLWTRVYMNK